jgi:hypothetical protein
LDADIDNTTQEYLARAPAAPDAGPVHDTLNGLLSQLARLN